MKIAIWHNLPSGGGKRALYYHARGLAGRGHKLACWTLDTSDASYLPLSEFAAERMISLAPSKRWGLSGKLTPDYHDAVKGMQAFDEACKRCALEIEAGGYDLLFANSAIDYAVPYIMRHVAIPKVLYLQEPCRFLYEASPALPWIASAANDRLYRSELLQLTLLLPDLPKLQTFRLQAKHEWLNAHAADLILVNSFFSRESVMRAYAVDASVCYLGVDTTLFRPLNLPRERYIVGVGAFNPNKRIELAIEAVALLPEPRRLVWIGNSGQEDYMTTLSNLARNSGVDLEMKLNVADAELVQLLNKGSLMVCTSRLEPFGFGVLEANACGLPVVAINEGGFRETIQPGVNGLLVDPDPAGIASAVNQLLENPDLSRRMGEAALSMIKESWTVEASIDRLETILQHVALTQKSKVERRTSNGEMNNV